MAEQAQTITLQPGESRDVSFTFTPTVAKSYSVSVDGLSRTFLAKIAPGQPGSNEWWDNFGRTMQRMWPDIIINGVGLARCMQGKISVPVPIPGQPTLATWAVQTAAPALKECGRSNPSYLSVICQKPWDTLVFQKGSWEFPDLHSFQIGQILYDSADWRDIIIKITEYPSGGLDYILDIQRVFKQPRWLGMRHDTMVQGTLQNMSL